MKKQFSVPGTMRPADWQYDLGFQREELEEEANGVREVNDPNYIFAHRPFFICPECGLNCGNEGNSPEKLGEHIITHEPDYDPADMFNPKPCPHCRKLLEAGNHRLGISGEDYQFHIKLCNVKAHVEPPKVLPVII